MKIRLIRVIRVPSFNNSTRITQILRKITVFAALMIERGMAEWRSIAECWLKTIFSEYPLDPCNPCAIQAKRLRENPLNPSNPRAISSAAQSPAII